jgi:hypothetical protein
MQLVIRKDNIMQYECGFEFKCECGFEFSRPGEYRNCQAFVTYDGKSGVICPECGNAYVDGVLVNAQTAPPEDAPAEKEAKND